MTCFRILVLLIFFVCSTTCKSQVIMMNKNYHDYGVIEWRSNSKSSFIIKNLGDKPLIIFDIRHDPYLIKVKAPRVPIEPGDSFILNIWYNSKRTGSFDKDILIVSNDHKNQEKIITLTGRVKTPALVLTIATDFAIWIFLYMADYRFSR